MLYMLTINGNQYGCYTTRANAVAALTDVRAEGGEGDRRFAELASQAADVDVDGSRLDGPVVAPHAIEQPVA